MALLVFQKPDKLVFTESTPTHGRADFKPLEPGYGLTIGNALRRILLSSPVGFAINSIKISGVAHEFATVPGVVEDVTNIILNLKKVRFKQTIQGEDDEQVTIKVSGKDKKQLTAGDIAPLSNFEVLNKSQVICHLDKSASFDLTLFIDKGRGWVSSDDIAEYFDDPERIAIDAIYTPILNVKMSVENTRVGQKTDYDRLILDIDTDGSVSPKQALVDAADVLISHLRLFHDETIEYDLETEEGSDTFDEATMRLRQLLKTKLSEDMLSVRALNCLRAAGIDTLGDLVAFSEGELLKIRNFGKKSLNEVYALLDDLKLTFDMDVAQYKLDRD